MTRRRPAIVRAVLAGVVLVTLVACGDGNGAAELVESEGTTTAAPDEPLPSTADSTAGSTPDSTTVEGQQPEGFTTVTVRITEPDGEVCEVCMWLADDPVERGRGLMGVTDLGDAAGMVFRFEDATTSPFYMFQTPSPLSIAWFALDGTHVGSADMEPCLAAEPGECLLYSPGPEYEVAIEVFRGGLEPLGLVAGSTVELIEGSEAERCPVVG